MALSCPSESRLRLTGRVFVDYPPHHLTRWRPDTLPEFLKRNGLVHFRTEIGARVRDIMWKAYVNRSVRRSSRQEDTPIAELSTGVRRMKMAWCEAVGALSFPIELVLRAAGVGTLGHRIMVRKE